ncbi:N(4)-(Beta-N-acetylglucosaminyl)-L-asparaginase-like [Gigantopelta aegis]|uniref:N(4)-(Beta-N-acetylglucosaminyl)-L-asparaginase- like n=1 Tax=Gigantopelta aegis TaxID=1735272 RepID=UPI001B88A9DC|nr:N(4)-(Beta-N-acetylglucosaminyl)-L-asparaginase-like [Gigantopelta aegis]
MVLTVIGTWPFAFKAVEVTARFLSTPCNVVDAVEAGINEIEQSYQLASVGCGGKRNAEGILEQDAAIMNGADLSFGSVTALQGISRPISVAKAVMEVSPHSMLTGEGALKFAIQQGFKVEDKLMKPQTPGVPSHTGIHDTLGVLAVKDEHVCAGVSTSGMAGKFPGRVGDSALPGCGLYADANVGAACSTGHGDEILKFCPSFKVVQFLEQNLTPQEACERTIREILERLQRLGKNQFEMAVMAVDMQGNFGTAGTVSSVKDRQTGEIYDGFPHVVWTEGMNKAEIKVQSPCIIK